MGNFKGVSEIHPRFVRQWGMSAGWLSKIFRMGASCDELLKDGMLPGSGRLETTIVSVQKPSLEVQGATMNMRNNLSVKLDFMNLFPTKGKSRIVKYSVTLGQGYHSPC